jgi:tetratricopeptide (TPR) repeat protein
MRWMFIFLCVSCASSHKSNSSLKNQGELTNIQFKKEKPLAAHEVKDYYDFNGSTAKSVMATETINHLDEKDLDAVESNKDPLLMISVSCAKSQLNEAFELASAHFNKFQKIPAYWNLIGNCHLVGNDFRKALLFYNKALELNPQFTPSLNNIGVMYLRQNQDAKALLAFQRALKSAKFSSTPRLNLSRLYLKYGLAELAIPLLRGFNPDQTKDIEILHAQASALMMLVKYEAALSFYLRMPRSTWDRPDIGLNVALTYFALGKKNDALDVFSNLGAIKDSNLKKYYAAVKIKLGQN